MTESCLSLSRMQEKIQSCFPELGGLDAARLAGASRLSVYRKNEWIFAEGDNVLTADWLLAGNVVLMKNSMSGKNTILHVVRPGHFIDHCIIFTPSSMGQLPNGGRALRTIVSAQALSRCEVLRIDAELLRSVVMGNPAFGMRLMRALAVRQRMFINKISVSQGKISGRRRVASWLLHKARVEKTRVLDDGITREVLAGLLGLSRESLCRQLSRFVQDGLIRLEKKSIIIEDERALRSCLDD